MYHYLAIKLFLWCDGFSDEKEFQNFFDKSINDAWLDMPEWQRDDYRFAVEMMKKEFNDKPVCRKGTS